MSQNKSQPCPTSVPNGADAAPATVPLSVKNPAGLTSLSTRVGDFRSFFESLRRRLSSRQYPELGQLQTRSLSDPTMALLDAWSVVGDVLTYYNERYTQESYLRTAREARSLQELSKLIGYKPGPGVASSTYLAFTLEKGPGQESQETLIPKGTQVQSVPGAGESAQTFETMSDLMAKVEWNGIKPRQTISQDITSNNVGQINSVTVSGITSTLVPNDTILFDFGERDAPTLRYVLRTQLNPALDSTTLFLVPDKLSANQFVLEAKRHIDNFVSHLLASVGDYKFRTELQQIVLAPRSLLIPEDGLIQLDGILDLEVKKLEPIRTELSSATVKLDAAKSLLSTSTFMANAKANTKPVLEAFVADQNRLPAVVAFLKVAWEGKPASGADPAVTGIRDDISTTDMKDRVTTAIGDGGAGITKEIASWNVGVLQDTAQTLLDNLASIPDPSTSIASDQRAFREAFLREWAQFTDLDLTTKVNFTGDIEYQVSKFESELINKQIALLIKGMSTATEDFESVANEVKSSLASGGWLQTHVGALPGKIRIQYTISTSATAKDFGPVDLTGLNARLKDADGVKDAIATQNDVIDAIVNGAKALKLDEFIANSLPMLTEEVKGVGQQVANLTTSTQIGTDIKKCEATTGGLEESASRAVEELGKLKANTLKLVKDARTNFDNEISKIVTAFGDPGVWDNSDSQAKNTKTKLLDPMDSFATPTQTLRESSESPDPNKSLLNVIKDLTDSSQTDYQPREGSPYAARYRVLLGSLRSLYNQVGPFSLLSQEAQPDERFPDAAGLADALALIGGPTVAPRNAPDRSISDVLKPGSQPGSADEKTDIPDLFRQLAGSLAPQLRDDLIATWRQIRARKESPRVFALKKLIPLFGYNAPFNSEVPESTSTDRKVKLVERVWSEVNNDAFRSGNVVYLSQPLESVVPGSFIVFRRPPNEDQVSRVQAVQSPIQPGMLNITLAGSFVDLVEGEPWHLETVAPTANIDLLRKTTAIVQSHELKLAEVPVASPVGELNVDTNNQDDSEIELDGLYPDLTSGRLMVVYGERSAIPGAIAQELVRVKYVRHTLVNRPGDKVHTRIVLTKPLQRNYNREHVRIYANVVQATHGETTTQILGSGDASKLFQSMPLAKGPLTYLPAPNETGVQSTLEVRVNNIQWHEQNSLLESAANGRDYVVQANPEGLESIQFGDGVTGARLPTGNSNVVATYRTGLGRSGNVRAKTLTNLPSRPMGVKDVTNPLPATGGADPETIEQIRTNAPIAVMALDRLVSVRDYADFARNFAGIDKAVAQAIRLGGQPSICITIAGAGDVPIAPDSELQRNLIEAYRRLGAPLQRVQIKQRELLLLFLSANIHIKPDYRFSFVEPMVRQSLYDRFSFARRELGQSLYLSEVYSAIQNIEGVAYVDIDIFATLSQSKFDLALKSTSTEPANASNEKNGTDNANSGSTNLPSLFAAIREPKPQPDKHLEAHSGMIENSEFAPAQLIYLSPDVPDSLFLTEVQ